MKRIAKVRTRQRGKKYSYIFEAGKNADGKRKAVEKGGFPTPESAYEAGIEAYNDWKHGNIGITSDKISCKEYLYNWLDNVASANVLQNTCDNYRFMLDRWIVPYIGGIIMQELSPAHIDRWIRKIAKDKSLAKNSLSSVKALLSHALNYAVYPCELIKANPAEYIRLPKAEGKKVARIIISPEKIQELFREYPFGNKYHMPMLIAYHTGMRVSEVLGLSWSGIDLDNNTISVVQQVKRLTGVGIILDKPKTSNSERTFIIDKYLSAELRRWKSQQAANELKAGNRHVYIWRNENEQNRLYMMSKGIAPDDMEREYMVCTDEEGRIFSKQSFFTVLRKAGLNSHSFRHTHATMLIEAGATPKDVAARLGHKDATITQNLYTHDTEKMQRETVDLFVKSIEKSMQTSHNADKLQTK